MGGPLAIAQAALGVLQAAAAPGRAVGGLVIGPQVRAVARALGQPESVVQRLGAGAALGTEIGLDPLTLAGIGGPAIARRLAVRGAERAALSSAARREALTALSAGRRPLPSIPPPPRPTRFPPPERIFTVTPRGQITVAPEARVPVMELPARVVYRFNRQIQRLEAVTPRELAIRGGQPVTVPLEPKALPAPRMAKPTPGEITIVRPRPFLETSPIGTATVEVPPEPARAVFPIGGGAGPQRVGPLQTPQVILNRAFGQGIGDNLVKTELVEARIFGPRNVDLRTRGLSKLSAAEDLNLFHTLEGRARPTTARVANVARAARRVFDEDAADYAGRGARVLVAPRVIDPVTGAVRQPKSWRPFQSIANYAPRMLDARRIAALPTPRLVTALERANAWLSPQQARDAAVALRAQALGMAIPSTVDQEIIVLVRQAPFLPTHLHARTRLRLPEEILLPMREAIPIYMEQAARERAFLRVFGADGDEAVERIIQQLGPRNPDVRLAEEVWDVYRGAFIQPESARRLTQIGRSINNLATATLLGFQTAVSQVSQFSALVGRLGVRPVAQGLARAVFQGGRLEAERAGAFVRSILEEYSLVSRLRPTATARDILEAQSAQLARGVIRYSGIQAMDQFPRAVGYHAASISLQDARRAAVLGNAHATQALAQVGLSARSTAEEIATKAVALTRTLNVSANFANLPYVLQTPIGAFARGLNTFNIQVLRMVRTEFVQPAIGWVRSGGRHGAIRPLLRLLGTATVAGEAIGETRRALVGRRGDRPGGPIEEFVGDLLGRRVPASVVTRRVLDDLAWAGTLGMLQGVWQSMQFAMSGTEAGARLVGTLTGAGISSVGELAGAVGEVARAPFAPTPEQRTRRLRTAARIVMRRIPVAGGLIAPRLFRSETGDRRTALAAIVRAIRRGDQETAIEIMEAFEQRHGARISQEAIDKAMTR